MNDGKIQVDEEAAKAVTQGEDFAVISSLEGHVISD